MKLHEEFNEYEKLWEGRFDYIDSYIKTFGKKKYDLANSDELEAWVNANIEFQMKRHPDNYPKVFGQSYPTRSLIDTVFSNLLDSLQKDNADTEILRALELLWTRYERTKFGPSNSSDSYFKRHKAIDKVSEECIKTFLDELNKLSREEHYGIDMEFNLKDKTVQSRIDSVKKLLTEIGMQATVRGSSM